MISILAGVKGRRKRKYVCFNPEALYYWCKDYSLEGRMMEASGERPGIWVGHVTRRVQDVKKSSEFFQTLGLHVVWADRKMAILELRGGTHLLLFPDSPRYKTIPNDEFDLMVENVKTSHEALQTQGVKVSRMKRDRFHIYFEASDPDGKKWRINSDHTEGRPV